MRGPPRRWLPRPFQRRERRLESLDASQRSVERDLVLEDLYVEPAHVKDPSLVFDGLIGCQEIKQKLTEYSAVVDAARIAGRDPMEDLGMTFCFQGRRARARRR